MHAKAFLFSHPACVCAYYLILNIFQDKQIHCSFKHSGFKDFKFKWPGFSVFVFKQVRASVSHAACLQS